MEGTSHLACPSILIQVCEDQLKDFFFIHVFKHLQLESEVDSNEQEENKFRAFSGSIGGLVEESPERCRYTPEGRYIKFIRSKTESL